MALILHIETSTNVCSVALSLDGKIIFSKIQREGPSHAVLTAPFCDEAIKTAESLGLKPDAVAVSAGPGSYTGLRIGVSIAKGICYGRHIPLISVPTLDLIADSFIRSNNLPENASVRPVLDARRMEVYTCLFDSRNNCIEPTKAKVVDNKSFVKELSFGPVYFIGNGAKKLRNVIASENALFDDRIVPLAEAMMPIAEKKFAAGSFVDVAYFEPFYLKEFIATIPKKNVIPGS